MNVTMRVDEYKDIISDARHYAEEITKHDLSIADKNAIAQMLLAYVNCLESFKITVEKECLPYIYEF